MTTDTDASRRSMVTGPFLLVTVAAFAYYMSVGVLIPTLPVFIENGLGYREAMIGAAAVAFSASAVLFRPSLTWIGNRWGRRTMMVGGGMLGAIAAFSTVFVTNAWQILPLRAVMGVGEAALFVGAATVIVELSPENRKAEGASYLSVAVFGGVAIGPIIGESVMGNVAESARGLGSGRYDAVFMVAAACCLVASLVSTRAPAFVGGTGETVRSDKVSLRSRWFHPRALLPGSLMALGIAAWTAFNSFVPTYAKALGLDGSARFFVVYSIVCLIIRLVGARLPERVGLVRSVTAALVFILLGVLSVAGFGSATGIWIGTIFFALGASFLYPSLLAMSVQGVDDDERVGVVASFTMFFELGGVLGGLALGGIGQAFGKRATFWGAAVFAISGLAVVVRHVRSTNSSPSRRAAADPAP
jgi:MFS family permease